MSVDNTGVPPRCCFHRSCTLGNASQIDAKLSCHGIYPQTGPDLPGPSSPVRTGRPLMRGDAEALVSTLKCFTPVSPSLHPVSLEASRCEDPSLPGLAGENVGLPSRFTAGVNLTAW